MSKPTDTNQAIEDKLRAEILTEFKQVHKLAPADYTENCTNVVMSIIRTEKLKLLAEVKERVVGSLEPQSENGLLPDRVDRRNQLRTEQLEVLTTQAQERRDLINQRNQYDDQTISGANNICGTITLHRRLGRQ